ncbi:hypothetical protein MNBD_GAMMA12-2395 [hydrothermal vent metagenome]|uniref:Short-chain dehydrogenase n=1 Tax=hydrothermal vent metagenome TaxID=652676 RepID=A0A3B0YIS1_9ZZZZ
MKNTQRVAIITGANRGIGYEICQQLLAKDYYVVLTARDEQKGIAACEKLSSTALEFNVLDVIADEQVSKLYSHIKRKHGRCDLLINNAGIFPDPRSDLENEWPSILSADINDIQAGINVNSYGTLRMCQAFVPMMQQNGYGRVVNLASGMAQLSDMNGCCPGYRISKTAINVITRILADELKGSNVLVNSMCPGWVKTEMGGPGATRDITEGADTAIWLATLPSDGPNGFFFRDRQKIDW